MKTVFLSEFNYCGGNKELVVATNNPRYPYCIRIDEESLPNMFYDVPSNKTMVSVKHNGKSVQFWLKGNKNFSLGGTVNDKEFYF